MATIGDYVNELLAKYRLPLGMAELAVIYLKTGVVSTDEISVENIYAMEVVLVSIIPDLLLTPDKQTGDTSLKWDRNAVLNWYKIKCAELGLPDLLTESSSITSLDNIW